MTDWKTDADRELRAMGCTLATVAVGMSVYGVVMGGAGFLLAFVPVPSIPSEWLPYAGGAMLVMGSGGAFTSATLLAATFDVGQRTRWLLLGWVSLAATVLLSGVSAFMLIAVWSETGVL